MKTNYIVGAALVAMFNCAIANADLLGGSLGGNLNATRDIGLTGHGNGAFGADFDSGPLRRTTSNVGDRAKATAAATKNAAAEKLQKARSINPEVAAEGNASVAAKK